MIRIVDLSKAWRRQTRLACLCPELGGKFKLETAVVGRHSADLRVRSDIFELDACLAAPA